MFGHKRLPSDFNAEIDAHIELETERLKEQGLSEEEARKAARRAFGNVTQAQERFFESGRWLWWDRLRQDVQYSLRAMGRNPGFLAVALLTLALGVGANTAMFSVVNTVLIRSLPYPDPGRLVYFTWQSNRNILDASTVPELVFFRDHSRSFEALGGYRGSSELSLGTGAARQWLTSIQATSGFFPALGVSPALGRSFLAEEDRPGGPRVVILSDGVWRRVFSAEPAILGRQIALNENVYAVVGVLPRGFAFTQPADVFIPLQLGSTLMDIGRNTGVLARLKPTVSLAQAQAEMATVFAQFRAAYPKDVADWGEQGARLLPYQKWLAGDFRPSLLLLFGAAGLFLLIACANVAALLLARTATRQREISIRLALGAGRRRLLSQFLTESLLLAAGGSLLGLSCALFSLHALVASIPWSLPGGEGIGLDANVLLFTLVVTVITTLAFGLASYLQCLSPNLFGWLKEGGPGSARGGVRARVRQALVIGEVAISVLLLIGTGLMVESLYRLQQLKLGFDPQGVTTLRTPFAAGRYQKPEQIWDFERQVLERFQAIPGTTSAAVVTAPPLTGPNNLTTQLEGHPEKSIGGMEYRVISRDYFQTMKIPLLRGRGFLDADTASATPVAIVSEEVARQWWPKGNPLGSRLVVGMYQGKVFPEVQEPPREVVGVVGDVRQYEELASPAPPTVYVPAAQLSGKVDSTAWVVRAQATGGLEKELRAAVASVDPEQRVTSVRSMSQIVSGTVAQPQFVALLLGLFAGLALLLASVGLYGVISYSVSQRTHEIGVRMALGAGRRDVLKLVVRQGLALTLIGVGIGLAAAFGLSRFISTLLFGVKASDPWAYLVVSLALTGVALLASFLPARRATKVDPLVALRYE